MHSGDRDPLADDPEWQAARLRHELSKGCNPQHSNTEIEMTRGRLLVERNTNAQYQEIARDALSEAFNPTHNQYTKGPTRPDGRVSPDARQRRNEYRNRLSQTNGGQNK